MNKQQTHFPKPIPWSTLSLSEVSRHRNFNCLFYEQCLYTAAKAAHESFTCLFCPFREEETNKIFALQIATQQIPRLFQKEVGKPQPESPKQLPGNPKQLKITYVH